MIQKEFAHKVVEVIKADPTIIGLGVGGSWISNELDEYSDLDLVLVTVDKIAGDKQKMLDHAGRFGNLLSAFTGEHVGEPRLLICMYDAPLLHVDIKFLTLPEFNTRIANPVVLFERDGQLSSIINSTEAVWPDINYQWIEDRFWTWVHYIATKIGRGEYFECLDSLSFLRSQVLAPLFNQKNKALSNGLRRAEIKLSPPDLASLSSTIALYDRDSILKALSNAVSIYRALRESVYPSTIQLQVRTEQRSLEYLEKIRSS